MALTHGAVKGRELSDLMKEVGIFRTEDHHDPSRLLRSMIDLEKTFLPTDVSSVGYSRFESESLERILLFEINQ